jgi:hypothetical protein
MAISFRYAHFDEYTQVAQFIDEYWAKDHIYVRSKPLFDWTFNRGGKHWEEPTYSLAVAEDNGELVGILGGIPFALNTFGSAARGVWIVNYVIRPDHRRGSAALQLLSTFRREPFQAWIAFGINPATSAIYRVLRGQINDEIPRHFLVLPGAGERMENLLRLTYPDWPPERTKTLAAQYTLAGLPETSAELGDSIPEDWDEDQWPQFAARTVGPVRDSDYLTWRYLRHPCFRHRVITATEDGRTGLAVWRLETIRRQTPECRQDVDRIGRLLEFMPVSAQNARHLLGKFLEDLSGSGAFGADFYCYHGETRSWLEQAGFASVRGGADNKAIPSRFQSLDGKGGGIMSATFLHEGIPSCSTGSDCAWYWTKSDSDQDRPN